MSPAGEFDFVDRVTSDLAFVARGASLEAVFSAAAEALVAATVERPAAVEPRVLRSVELRDRAPDLLLLRFLNELIYLRDAEGLLLRVRSAWVQPEGEARVRAELEGEPLDAERHGRAGDVKAATAHGLELVRTDGGWRATVTLDV
jgi:SHS2 domain-containing protein